MSRGSSHPNKNAAANFGVLLSNSEQSMGRETANTSKIGATTTSHHQRVPSNPSNNYVKVQNSEIHHPPQDNDPMFQSGIPPGINNYTTAGNVNPRAGGGIPHTLGSNSLGGNAKQSLNMSNYGGYFSAIQRDSSLNENNTLAKTGINLNSLIRQNLLEEDGIEDLHFYFVSFQQHKKQILAHQKKRQEAKKAAAGQMMNNAGKAGGMVGGSGPRMVAPKIPIGGAQP